MSFDARKPAPKGPAKKSRSKPKPPPPDKPLLSTDQWLDLLGLALIGLAGLTVLGALSSERSALVQSWLSFVTRLFGWGAYLAPAVMIAAGAYLLFRRFGDRFPRLAPGRILGALVAFLAALGTLHIVGMTSQPDAQVLAEAGEGGGYTGGAIVAGLRDLLGDLGAALVVAALWAIALMLVSNVSLPQAVDALQRRLARRLARPPAEDIIVPSYDRERGAEPQPHRSTMGDLIINGLRPRRPAARKPEPSELDEEELPPRVIGPADQAAPAARSAPAASPSARPRVPLAPPMMRGDAASGGAGGAAAPAQAVQPAASGPSLSARLETRQPWALPQVDKVLEPGNDAALKEADIRLRAQVIEETLRAFGVPGRVVEVNRGPTITQYGVEPGFVDMKGGKQVKVKVSRIAGLADDLALALSAPRIRIEAPVPGRAVVGIEVPNSEVSLVSLRDVMESEEFEKLARKTRLRLGLGQDVSGHPVIADLTAMPHLLIAGTTGSGKSVCVNAIITALLSYNSPEDLRFLMVDPKRVELTGYNGIPHLIAPVVVDLEKVTGVLQWVTREMENRYRMFAKHGVRNILDFNGKVALEDERRAARPEPAAGLKDERAPDDLRKIPYIVVVIDELADLMMLAPDETEKTLCRLAQMARATGIHLMIATQRPSVDVVTGLIKANFPARIAFTVATSVDSRVILDTPGAEKLLGRGDMLVVTPDSPLPTRAQGCFVSDKEINRVVRHWRAQAGAGEADDPIAAALTAPSIPMTGTLDGAAQAVQLPLPPQSEPLSWDEARALSDAAEDAGGSREDKLFSDAVATVRLQGKASISLLQRRLRIGYTRAARLIEQMEERGIVGPSVAGSQFREVLPPAGQGE